MISIRLKTTNGQKLNKFVRSLKFKEPLKKSEKRLLEDLDRNFDQQGAILQGGGFKRSGGAFANLSRATTYSSSWEPLKASTRKDRVRKGYGAARPILERTGKLRNGFVSKVKEDEIEVRNDVEYGKYHQYGTKHMAARKIIGFSQRYVDSLVVEIIRYLSKKIRSLS